MMDIEGVLLQQFFGFSIKRTSGGALKNENMSNQHPFDLAHITKVSDLKVSELAEELHKPIMGKFEKGKVYSPIDTFIDIFSKCAWVIPLKDTKGITLTNFFQKFLDVSNCKPNKIWVDKGSEFYNRSMKSLLQDNNIEVYSAHTCFFL